MTQQLTQELSHIADSMGLALYQRLSVIEASLFLRCPVEKIQKLQRQKKIGYIQLPSDQVEFFGYQLLEYLLSHVSEPTAQSRNPENQNQERILRLEEVTKMVGLSRTTLWRMERKGEFPARVPLSSRSVGWRFADIDRWMRER